jgi:hypothetical protein
MVLGLPAGFTGADVVLDKDDPNRVYINNLYKAYLGREISNAEWQDYFKNKISERGSWEDLVKNSQEASDFSLKKELGEAKSWTEQQAEKKAATTPTSTDQTMDWIKTLYASMQPEIEAGVKSAAAQRGGLDTGGYLTAMGKAKASTWQDMLKTMIGQYNTSQSLAESKRQFDVSQATSKESLADYYKLLKAQTEANTPNAWQSILSGASQGATIGTAVGGPGWGTLIGGLAGWGAKQGLFR